MILTRGRRSWSTAGAVWHLNSDPAIGRLRPRHDLRRQIVENQIAASGTHDENKVMLSPIRHDPLSSSAPDGQPRLSSWWRLVTA